MKPTDRELLKMDSKTFQKLVFTRFKKFFSNAGDLKQSLMAFGICVDCGWYPLVYHLLEDIETQLKKTPVEDFEVVQIKEKFGGIRVYVGSGNEKIFDMINKAEEKSYKICERCGARGSLDRSYGWLLTLCAKCKRTRKKEKDAEAKKRLETL